MLMYYPKRIGAYFTSLFDLFGFRLMFFIVLVEHVFKGFIFGGGSSGFIGVPILFIFRSFEGLSSINMQILKAVSLTPWTIKSLFGVISDTVYIHGYNRFPYMVITLITSFISCIIVAMMWPLTPITYTFFLFVIFLHMSVADLLTEAKYSEKIAQFPYKGPDLLSFIWGGIFAGQILSNIITGVLISGLDTNDLHYIYLIPAGFLLFVLFIPTINNWVGDAIKLRSTFHDNVEDIIPSSSSYSHTYKKNSIVVENCLCNLLWLSIPPSFSYYYDPLKSEVNKNHQTIMTSFQGNSKMREEISTCLLCNEYINGDEDRHVEEMIEKMHGFIRTFSGTVTTEILAKMVHNSFIDRTGDDILQNRDDDDDNKRSPYLKKMTKEIIMHHIQGLHKKKIMVTEYNGENNDDNNELIELEEEEEENDTHEEEKMIIPLISIDTNKIQREWKIILLAIIIGCVSLIMGILGLFQLEPLYLCIASLISSFIILVSFGLLVDKTIALLQAFILLQNTCSVEIGVAAFFFYTDNEQQYPEGPHFSKHFYVTVMGLVGSVCGVLGIFAYNIFLKHLKYRTIFLYTNILLMFVSLTNVILFKRWNLLVGIPDSIFVLGTETVQVIVATWTYMPATIITSNLCPKGLEATMFAILAGSNNLGNAFASYQGAYLLQLLGITPNGSMNESAKFDNLYIVAAISAILPCAPLILLNFLVPDSTQDRPLLYSSTTYEDADIEQSINS
jgi:hypothetical protein